jgi:hypothetical protein
MGEPELAAKEAEIVEPTAQRTFTKTCVACL